MKKILMSTALFSLASLTASAESTTKTYEVKRGFAKTFSVTSSEQLGTFKAVLKAKKKAHKGSKHHKRKLVLEGTIKGLLNPNFTLNHTFVNKKRTGVIYTANDSITNVFAGDPTCENGTGSTPWEVEETLNIVAGTGIYADLEQGSVIVLKGVINNCPSLPKYGKNTFEVVGGTVTFSQ